MIPKGTRLVLSAEHYMRNRKEMAKELVVILAEENYFIRNIRTQKTTRRFALYAIRNLMPKGAVIIKMQFIVVTSVETNLSLPSGNITENR